MINNIQFGVYDQLGYILVGLLELSLVWLNTYIFKVNVNLSKNAFINLIGYTLISYFLGHLTQAVANIVINEKSQFQDKDKKILQNVVRKYDLEKDDFKQAFGICYMISNSQDNTGQIAALNANYGMYRGWALAFVLQAIFSILGIIASNNKSIYVLIGLLSIILAYIFFRRAKRFYSYIGAKVLQVYLITLKKSG